MNPSFTALRYVGGLNRALAYAAGVSKGSVASYLADRNLCIDKGRIKEKPAPLAPAVPTPADVDAAVADATPAGSDSLPAGSAGQVEAIPTLPVGEWSPVVAA